MEKIEKRVCVYDYIDTDEVRVIDLIDRLQQLVQKYGDTLVLDICGDYGIGVEKELSYHRLETDEEYQMRINVLT